MATNPRTILPAGISAVPRYQSTARDKTSWPWLGVLLLVVGLALPALGQQERLAELNEQAKKLWREGKYTEAISVSQEALRVAEKTFGPAHPNVAGYLNNLGMLYDDQRRYAEAELLYKRSLAIQEKALGPEHPDVARGLNNLAVCYEHQGNYTEAEALFKRSRTILEKALGPNDPRVALGSLINLAVLYRDQGKYEEAEALYKRSLVILEEALGPEHPHVASTLEGYVVVLRKMKRESEAKILEARAKAIRAKQNRTP